MKGYAITIQLLEWKKSEQDKTVFKEVNAHYLGNFSRQTGEKTYNRLSKLLLEINPVSGTNMRRKKRGNRR